MFSKSDRMKNETESFAPAYVRKEENIKKMFFFSRSILAPP